MMQSFVRLQLLVFAISTPWTVSATTLATTEQEKSFKISATAPATNYQIRISGVYRVKKEIWIISKIQQVGDIGGAALTMVSDTVHVKTSDLPKEKFKVIHKISGRVIKDGRTIGDTPEIEDLKNRIKHMNFMYMKRNPVRSKKMTAESYREFQAKLHALEKQLQKLQSRAGQAQNVEHLSPTAEKQLERTLSSAKKIPFFRKDK